MSLSLAGKTVLITGASSGLGPHIARKIDAAGAIVVIHYLNNRDGAEALAKELRQPAILVQANLQDSAQVKQLFGTAVEQAREITLLVNCAAAESQDIGDLKEFSIERWQTTQQTNVEAPLLLIQIFAAQGINGAIVNISSIEGSIPAPNHGHYSTSKAALEMLTRSAALELGSAGIRVNAVAPGLIHRDGIEEGWPEGVAAWNESAPLGKLVQPENIADAVLFLASDASASTSGVVLTVDCEVSVTPSW